MTSPGVNRSVPSWPRVSRRAPLIGVLDASADRYLRACIEALQECLGPDLVGAYLYSSAALGDFVAGGSDLDVVAVVRVSLDRDRALGVAASVRAVAAPFATKGLDLTVVTLAAARAETAMPRVEVKLLTFHGDIQTAQDEPYGDNRVVMHFACCRDHGIAVTGPPPQEVFAPVSRREYLLALRRELNRVWMPPHYTVLNACRDLRFVVEGVICSKVAGGRWALERGYDRWLIEAALSWQMHGIGPVIDGTLVDAFAGTVGARIDAAIDAGSPPPAAQPQLTVTGAPAGQPTPLPDAATARAVLGRQPEDFDLSPQETPLVSCVLVAGADQPATLRAVGWFDSQDYPARELIVVASDAAADDLRAAVSGVEGVRVVVGQAGTGVDAWRDTGCAYGDGALFALWDESAWYASWRLRYQVGALLRTSHEISASTAAVVWDPAAGRCWPQRSNPVVDGRSLIAATVCLTRDAWRRVPFARRSLIDPDDPALLDAPGTAVHVPRGAQFAVIVSPHRYVDGVQSVQYPPDAIEALLGPDMEAFAVEAAVGPSAAPQPAPPAPAIGREMVGRGIEPIWDERLDALVVPAFAAPSPEPAEPAEPEPPAVDPPAPRSVPTAAARRSDDPAAPLVSCIMPTFNRRRFVAQTRRNLARQDYPNLELVVVDDGTEPVVDLLEGLPRCQYVRLDERLTIGQKRNLACEMASGEIVVQWDDDDWYGPSRVSRQVSEIRNGNADMSGIGVNLLLDVRQMRMWATREREAAEPLFGSIEGIAGGTLAFGKHLWRAIGGYPDASLGEDVGLLRLAADSGARIAPLSNNGAYVYIRHGRNSWRYDFDPEQGPPGWQPGTLPPAMDYGDLAFYAALAPTARGDGAGHRTGVQPDGA